MPVIGVPDRLAAVGGQADPRIGRYCPRHLVANPQRPVRLPVAIQVFGADRRDLITGDRGPGYAARARIADDDRVGQRLAGSDVADRRRDARTARVIDLADRQDGRGDTVGIGRRFGVIADGRCDGGRVRDTAFRCWPTR